MTDQDPMKTRIPDQKAIVEVTDAMGRLVDRTPFETDAEAQQHAEAMRAEGNKASVSSMEPKRDA